MIRQQIEVYVCNYKMRANWDEFYANLRKIRDDFDKIATAKTLDEVTYLRDKYEYMIHDSFETEPYVRIFPRYSAV